MQTQSAQEDQKIRHLRPSHRQDIRRAVGLAVRYWPNAHLGYHSAGEDIRSAFLSIRNWAPRIGLQAAIGRLELDAYRHADM